MTTCPKCSSTNVHSDRGHKAAHGLHRSVHVGHLLPFVGLWMATYTALEALLGVPHYHCGNCKHSF